MTARIINLFGGPGVGKSTTAAEVFSLLKKSGRSAELVTEYAKDLVYDDNKSVLQNQFAILGEQDHRLWRLKDKVTYVVTDSPILLGLVYADPISRHGSGYFENAVRGVFRSYENINFLLRRNPRHTYQPEGRIQKKLNEAEEFDARILRTLVHNDVDYTPLMVGEHVAELIVQQIINREALYG